MGCVNTDTSYFNTYISEEESKIREWEKEISCFTVDFNTVYKKLLVDLEVINKIVAKRVIENQLSPEFYNVIERNEYFIKTIKHEDTEFIGYDFNKVIALLYLLTAPGFLSNNYTNYFDKAYYLFIRSKSNEEDDLSHAFTRNINFNEIVKVLILTVSKGEVFSYLKLKEISDDRIINQVEENIDKIAEYIIEDFFTVDKKKVEFLSFEELNKKFSDFPYYFTGGHIREKSLEYLHNNISNST